MSEALKNQGSERMSRMRSKTIDTRWVLRQLTPRTQHSRRPSASVQGRQCATNHSREHERKLASLLREVPTSPLPANITSSGEVLALGAASAWVDTSAWRPLSAVCRCGMRVGVAVAVGVGEGWRWCRSQCSGAVSAAGVRKAEGRRISTPDDHFAAVHTAV